MMQLSNILKSTVQYWPTTAFGYHHLPPPFPGCPITPVSVRDYKESKLS